ncbi:hydroxymethylpyrimidine/phosphomethylpyrimidine kinase [Methanomicrobium sp. W14]|uniref:bifunctional hydroxymethylpyrimidine kinase/phosphomethylpyrimidine kinase n=1 Tax=Methanomicrobium sp. W14 TaxID=2817839 RepID=UPI001AE53A79|nr:bifunctional hydroxymethylpyrimidine kinase/phosphomethylpyrimidine kinase [Methanomicrobium sp. W14]MBP2132232.1 hydroxymethylpyrimidine/phosphomethylpyrimidine kinase [Methanomicrobium sp. W14]
MMKEAHMPCACTIAGSDSGGGAGIQADLKTFSSCGVWGCCVITSITAQNPANVNGIWSCSTDAVSRQIESVFEEFEISAVKCGMMPSAEIIEAVFKSLPSDVLLVIDPVMVSTSGKALSNGKSVETLKKTLIPECTLVTPNIPEACALSGLEKISSEEEILSAGKIILGMGAKNVLIKGGHMKGPYSEDYLIGSFGFEKISGARFSYDIHGTGCALSAAVTAGLSLGKNVRESCAEAKRLIESAIKHAYVSRNGYYSINPYPIKIDLSNNKDYIHKN